MTDLIASEIASVAKSGLGVSILLLDPRNGEELVRLVVEKFVDEPNRIWWWEGFVGNVISFENPSMSLEWMNRLSQSPDEPHYLVTLPDAGEPQLVYRGKVTDIRSVLRDCSAFEFAIVPVNLDWIACENHHNLVVIAGVNHGFVTV